MNNQTSQPTDEQEEQLRRFGEEMSRIMADFDRMARELGETLSQMFRAIWERLNEFARSLLPLLERMGIWQRRVRLAQVLIGLRVEEREAWRLASAWPVMMLPAVNGPPWELEAVED